MKTRGQCRRCHRDGLTFKGRRLCDSCWNRSYRDGTLDDYPLVREPVYVFPYCTCPPDTPVESVFAGALQCGECRRKVFGKHEPMPEFLHG